MQQKKPSLSKAQLEDIRQNLFTKTGEMQFKKEILSLQLANLNEEINKINQQLFQMAKGEAVKAVPEQDPAIADPDTVPPPPAPEEMPAPEGV